MKILRDCASLAGPLQNIRYNRCVRYTRRRYNRMFVITDIHSFFRRKEERERAMDVEDETTQTSSPGGGWQGRLSAFLHVHRGSRASSRKSSRASDASDLSELGGPWLNLPLLLLSNAVNMDPEELHLTRESADVNIQVSEATPEATTPATPLPDAGGQARRKSVYNFPFFLRHQDAVETPDDAASPPLTKRSLRSSGTAQSLHPAMAEDAKPKRGSLIRRKRASSMKIKPSSKSALGKAESEPLNGADVSILVTEPSPETPSLVPPLLRQQSESTVVHVLVHRESEEYRDEEQRTPSPTICVTEDNPECHGANLTVTVTPSDFCKPKEEHQDS